MYIARDIVVGDRLLFSRGSGCRKDPLIECCMLYEFAAWAHA